MTADIGVYTSVCEEDAMWVEQYLDEIERLRLPFAIHLDRCDTWTKDKLRRHRLCIGATVQQDFYTEFNETHKQGAFDIVVGAGFKWAMAWDIDETYERDAPRKLEEISKLDVDHVDVRWLNLLDDHRHIRIDPPFDSGHRVKFYRLGKIDWRFAHKITNGPKPISGEEPHLGRYDLVCLHWGMMTKGLRLLHKERWDRIYTKAVGKNPYGFWKMACDEENHPAVVVEHDYL